MRSDCSTLYSAWSKGHGLGNCVGWLRNQCCHLCPAAGLGMLGEGCAEPQAAAWAKVENGVEDPSTSVSSAVALGRWEKEVFSLG